MSKETELSAARQFVEHANDEILKLQKAGTEQQEELNKANEKIRFLAEELTATTDDLSRTRVFLKESNAKVELLHSTESELKVQLKLAGDQINELSGQLAAGTRELMDAVSKGEKSSGEIQENLVKAQEQIAALQRETQLKSIELEAVCASLNEASVTIEELESRGDPQKLQADLKAAMEEIQMLRRKFESATENLSKAEEKMVQLTRAQTARGKFTPEPPIHCKLDLSVETLRRELAAAQARNETLQLQFETEEENRKKKIERLEKEIESLKEQVKVNEIIQMSFKLNLLFTVPQVQGGVAVGDVPFQQWTHY